VNKNWPNDCKVGCKSPFNILDFIGINVNLEVELEQFEGVLKVDFTKTKILLECD
jgi:hypothetical protein